MAITFHLYRLKVERLQQRTLNESTESTEITSSEIVEKAIRENPSKELRKNHKWHTGNVESIDDNGLFFAIGKVTKLVAERFDKESNTFLDAPDEHAPYTYVLIDLEHQVCGIAHKPKVSQKNSIIASSLGKLLDSTEIAKNMAVVFNISEIKDPKKFIEQIESAFAIKKFDITFTLPNPQDVNKLYHEPFEKLVQAANGKKGKTSIKGEKLDKVLIKDLASSVASSGDSASARIQAKEDGPVATKKIGSNFTKCTTGEIKTEDKKINALKKIKDIYNSIRNYGDET